MSVFFGVPLALAALAALLVPLLLHLDRRRSVRLLRFAALRWIGARAKPRRTWRLVEWLLLALRLLLVAVLAVWLAQPWLRGLQRDPVHWIVVAPGASDVPMGASAEHAVWLALGFPSTQAPMPKTAGDSISSLLREFDARVPPGDRIEVRVPTDVSGLDASAITLSREVEWVVVGTAPEPPRAAPPNRLLAVRYTDEADPSLPYVRAAIRAWSAAPELAVDVDEGPSQKPVPAHADAVLRLDGTPPDAARVQSADYPRELHRTLFGAPPPPDRAPAAEVAPRAGAVPIEPPATALRPWLAWLAAGLFLLERVLANGRRLARAA